MASKKIATLYAEITGDTTKLNKSLSSSKTALTGLNKGAAETISSMTGLNLASAGAGAAIGAIALFAKQALSETEAYARSVRDLSKITGDSAESTSRLIQVSDDLLISEEELGTALQGAVRKGIDVSVEGLMKLSDQYTKLEPGLERSKFLMDTFGRSGVSMAMMMEQGADGIKSMLESQSDSLVMTQENIDASREYEKAMDDLGDMMQGFKYTIGNTVIVPLTNAAKAFSLLVKWTDSVNDAYAEHERQTLKTAGSYREYADEILNARIRTGELTEVRKRMIMDDIEAGKSSYALTKAFGLQTEASYNRAKSLEMYNSVMRETTEKTNELVLSEDELKAKFSEVSSYISGDVTETYNKFNEKNNELWGTNKKIVDKITELESKSWLTTDQKKELATLEEELGKNKRAIEANEEAYKKEYNTFILNTFLKYAALDGLSAKDLDVYTKMAENMGLIDQPTKDLIEGIGNITKEIDGSKTSAQEFANVLAGIPDKDVYVRTHYVSYGGQTGGHEDEDNGLLGGYASGASFTVPPSYSGDSFGMRVQSGEKVKVTQAGVPDDTARMLRNLPSLIGRAVRDGVIQGLAQ